VEQIPCFNVSSDGFVQADATVSSFSSLSSTTMGPATTSTSSVAASDSPTARGLSGGAIAGVVVGVVAGLALVLATAFLFYRRRQTAARAREIEVPKRAVKWPEEEGKREKRSSTS
jgi:hypothetical protein